MNCAVEIQEWLDSRADEMADLVVRLVAVNTENPPGRGLGACAAVLSEAMRRLGVATEVHEIENGGALEAPCIVRGTVGDGERVVYFHGHFDVVPAQSPTQFEPRRENGRITGRGTADMKGGLVSMLYGAVAARDLGLLGDARIVLHFVCDEETGSTVGSGHLRAAEMIDPSAIAMVTAEPTGGVVWHACRGAITMRVSVRGKEAHVGLAHQGVNAFEHLIRVAAPVVRFAAEVRTERTAFTAESEEAQGSMMVVGGGLGAGVNFNVVPGAAWFSVDWRFNPEKSLEAEMIRLTDTIHQAAEAAGADIQIDVLQQQPSGSTEPTHPQAAKLATAIAAVEGRDQRYEL